MKRSLFAKSILYSLLCTCTVISIFRSFYMCKFTCVNYIFQMRMFYKKDLYIGTVILVCGLHHIEKIAM